MKTFLEVGKIVYVCVWIPLILLKTENKKKNIFWLLFINEFTVHWPDCTIHGARLKKKKTRRTKQTQTQTWVNQIDPIYQFFFFKFLNQLFS